MTSTHYDAFQKHIGMGSLDSEDIGEYLRDISVRAKHLVSPIGSQDTKAAFGMSDVDFGDCLNAFIERSLPQGKVLPLDDLVCVEDELSAVFVENYSQKEKTLRLTTFVDTSEGGLYGGVLCYGLLTLLGYDRKSKSFNPSDVYGAYIFEDFHKPFGGEMLEIATEDLLKSAVTVIEQLTFMDKEGLISDTKRLLV